MWCQVTVGLPGRGKTYIARKVARYLRWINYRARVFSVAKYRQDKLGQKSADFFDFSNESYMETRNEILSIALEDVMRYLNKVLRADAAVS
jgi:signal recognition particle GTPase